MHKLGLLLINTTLKSELRFVMANGYTFRQGRKDVDSLGETLSVFELNAHLAHRAVDLGGIEQQSDYAEDASFR